MKMHTNFFGKFLFALAMLLFCGIVNAANGVNLYTPYKKISVPPGQTIDYNIDIINDGNGIKNVDISIIGMPKGWEYSLKSGGWSVQQISILPREKKTFNLKVEVPLNASKGNHYFKVMAKNYDDLPLVVTVTEQGTFKTEFTTDQANMQGNAKSNFTYNAKLRNLTGEKQIYSLQADVVRGWEVTFKPNYKQATAVEVEPNGTANISVEIKSPFNIEAGTYKIPVRAVNSVTSVDLNLEVVITGTYAMELTTPKGLLSSSLTAGREKILELLVKNTGSSKLTNIRLVGSKPLNWEISYEPDTIKQLNAGEEALVKAKIKAYEKAIPGDYVTHLTAQTPEVNSTAVFRISVKTPLLWGWLGILIIFSAIGFIYHLFRKFGRR